VMAGSAIGSPPSPSGGAALTDALASTPTNTALGAQPNLGSQQFGHIVNSV
jgi:hypothetical protein